MRWDWMLGPATWTCGARDATGDNWCYHHFRWSRQWCVRRRARKLWRAGGGLRAPREVAPPVVQGWVYLAVTTGEAQALVGGSVPDPIRVRLERQLEAQARLVG